ncbi:MAG: ChbG/HpnK family deacetylase [Syntrophales bacterium]|nr:ChbG/HpnK family deacetylase [Syntrophales bacterium]
MVFSKLLHQGKGSERKMKKLIINADDLGADESRNRGILEAMEAGIVTSATILANGPAFLDAIRGLRKLRVGNCPVGIHLNLSEGKPLAENIRLLTGIDGHFRGKTGALSFFEEPPTPALKEELYREAVTQIERILDQGFEITHIDGHHHIHLFPAVIESVLRAASNFAIPWIRLADEKSDKSPGDNSLDREALRFQGHASRARELIDASNLRATDHFLGLYLKGRLTLEALLETVDTLPEGLTELMVHPGSIPLGPMNGPFSSFATKDRQIELDALMSPEFRKRLDERGVILTSFAEMAE